MDRNFAFSSADSTSSVVATREGGVDRNVPIYDEDDGGLKVATREGGVDRNGRSIDVDVVDGGRHPRGWRG